MSHDEIFTKLTDVFRDVFDQPELELRPEMRAPDVKGWDSLGHIMLIVAVEKGFAVRLTTSEIQSLSNVGDLSQLVASKLA